MISPPSSNASFASRTTDMHAMVEVANGDDPDLVSDRLRVFGAVGVEIRDLSLIHI